MALKNQSTQPAILYRVVLAVLAENLPQVHKVLEGLAAMPEISHWYDEPQTLKMEDAPAMEDAPVEVKGGHRLVEQILHHAKRTGGVTCKELKGIAARSGFNVGSVSPTLVKLVKDKKIKRIGKGVYATYRAQG
jgi:hypothetical protein